MWIRWIRIRNIVFGRACTCALNIQVELAGSKLENKSGFKRRKPKPSSQQSQAVWIETDPRLVTNNLLAVLFRKLAHIWGALFRSTDQRATHQLEIRIGYIN